MWQRLRSLRADPPDLAATGDRRTLFNAALEQCEQLLRGAEGLGLATKPINLFYGLSQGGRALAAALSQPYGGRLSGHGITAKGGLDRPVQEIQLVNQGTDASAFRTIARLRRAPSLPAPAELGDLLASLPFTSPGRPSWRGRPTAVAVIHKQQGAPWLVVSSDRAFAFTGPWPDVEVLKSADVAARRAWAEAYIDDHFPALRGASPFPDEDVSWPLHGGARRITMQFDLGSHVGSDALREDLLLARFQRIGDHYFATPTIAPGTGASDPLVVLWAILWTFSMLARYEPVRWSQLLDVDASVEATAIEELLNDALDYVPWFLLQTLDRLPA